jgi:hypothetical protein
LHSGLRGRVSNTGGFNRIWLFVLNYLNITGYPISPTRLRHMVVVGEVMLVGHFYEYRLLRWVLRLPVT